MPLYLTEGEVAELLTPADALSAVEACFQRMARGEGDNRPRVRQKADGGAFAVMSAVDHELGLAGLKSYLWVPRGTPFVVCLFEVDRGALAAVIEADKLGQLRTGAASGVAAKYLAREGAATLGVIGCGWQGGSQVEWIREAGRPDGGGGAAPLGVIACGWQAESQVECIREAVPTIERVVAYCREEERLNTFCRKVDAEPGEMHQDAGSQEVVVTATTSRDPVLLGEWLQPRA